MLAPGAAIARAQTLEGRVVDERSRTPVSVVAVRLLAADLHVVDSTVSDSLGHYDLDAPRPGSDRIEADVIGYETLRSPLFSLSEDTSYEIDLELRADPIELEEMTGSHPNHHRYCASPRTARPGLTPSTSAPPSTTTTPLTITQRNPSDGSVPFA